MIHQLATNDCIHHLFTCDHTQNILVLRISSLSLKVPTWYLVLFYDKRNYLDISACYKRYALTFFFTWKHVENILLFRNVFSFRLWKFSSSYVLFLLQVVVFETRVKTPQGLYALAKALSQKGVAKKIQVPILTLSLSSGNNVFSGSLIFLC